MQKRSYIVKKMELELEELKEEERQLKILLEDTKEHFVKTYLALKKCQDRIKRLMDQI